MTRYLTPLGVKVPLFTTLYHWPNLDSAADWQEIHGVVLTDLLADLPVQYPRYDRLQGRILGVARGLEPNQDYLAAADRLLRTLKPIYQRYGSPGPAPQPTLVSPNTEELTHGHEHDHEATCALFPPPPNGSGR